jgi:hypothetical protein
MGIGVDVFPYTVDEARKALREGWGVVRTALEEGLVLFERGTSLKDLRAGPACEGVDGSPARRVPATAPGERPVEGRVDFSHVAAKNSLGQGRGRGAPGSPRMAQRVDT